MEPAGDTVLQTGAGTEPQWLPGLNCGTPPGPAAQAVGSSVCGPL